MASHVANQESPPPVVPPCEHCKNDRSVEKVEISEVAHGVECWRCSVCGLVWATRDDIEKPDSLFEV
jgi:hypothetical protein